MTTPHPDGPDWSHYQTLTGQAVDPAWRLWSYKCSEGAYGGDGRIASDRFAPRWAWAREHGFRWRGAYHWLRGDAPMKDQAVNLYRRVDAQGGLHRGEFVQCDWEVTLGVPLPTSLQAAEWCDRVQQHYGRPCVIMYSSDWLPDSTLDADSRREFEEWRQENPTFPYWHANYNTTPSTRLAPNADGWTECALYRADVWQWTSTYTHPSVVGGFDMNHVFNPAVLDAITDQTLTPTIPLPLEAPDVITPIDGVRMLDTRVSGPLKANEPRHFEAPVNTPGDATGLALNLTFLGSFQPGFLTVWSGVGDQPGVSQLNWLAGAAPESGFTIVRLDGGGFVAQSNQEVQLLIDCVGYTSPPIPGPIGASGAPGAPGPAGEGCTPAEIVAAVVAKLTGG